MLNEPTSFGHAHRKDFFQCGGVTVVKFHFAISETTKKFLLQS